MVKIKKIILENHYILGDMVLDFTDSNGNILDTIIIAGENGTGKSTVLNLISELFNFRYHTRNQEKVVYELELSEDEINNLLSEQYIKDQLATLNELDTIKVTFDTINYPKDHYTNNWFEVMDVNDQVRKIQDAGHLRNAKLKSIFSDVEINFQGRNISSVTSKELDQEIQGVVKSNNNLSQEITQLLIDIQSIDDSEVGNWARQNIGIAIPESIIDKRSGRFKTAFENMFDFKKYKGIETVGGSKKVTFLERGKDIYIEDLSSGEKQIVYRGAFCLKDKSQLEGSIAMIDEPEISLHPEWQKKIVPFYRDIFTNEKGEQTSQLFIVTHSPFIIHNENRRSDKIIILKKDVNGSPVISYDNKFYGWTNEEIVKEAFNIDEFIQNIPTTKPLIITEGKTDIKHIKAALNHFKENEEYVELDVNFFEFTDETQMGATELSAMCRSLNQMEHNNKILCLFDRDVDKILKNMKIKDNDYHIWGKSVASVVLPFPTFRENIKDIFCIEHYYSDDVIKNTFENKRLYLGDEFRPKHGGISLDGQLICKHFRSGEVPKEKIGDKHILDSNAVKIENLDSEERIMLLSKNEFADCILEKKEGFENIDFESFRPLLSLLKEVIEEGSTTQFS